MRLLPWILVLIGLACDQTQQVSPPDPPLKVAAAAYAVADIARQVGASDVETVWALESPEAVDHYEPTSSDLESLRGADVLIVAGAIDTWVLEDRISVQRERGLVRLNVLPGFSDTAGSALWLDPDAAKTLADELSRVFYARRPKHRQQFEEGARRFNDSLAAARRQFEGQLANAAGKKVGTLSPTFDSLLQKYQITAIRLSEVPPHQLTNIQMYQLKQFASEQGIHWLALDTSVPDSLAEVIASRTGLKLLRLEALGSSSANRKLNTYIDLCRYNLQELCKLTAP